MPLMAGDKLGPYEILAPLGAGGMGEVYRARDTKLDREVAIKVLPAALAHDPERLARFEREAKVLASLNHPNIAQIYGVEESSGIRALVMELEPGACLKTPLALDVALNYARQIADALEAAHDKGIIHRDLKPANIMVTPEGVVKVLDFGLAAVAQPPGSSGRQTGDDPSHSPTMTMAATQAGMIMGTAAYMSPEQAAGKPVDKRADIWSYGVVLWEMLTGQRLFDGETVSHTLADVLRAPIDFEKLPAATPRAIRDLVQRCLDRDVKARLRDIGEARVVIQKWLANPDSDVAVGATGYGTPPAEAGATLRRVRLPWIAAALLALVAAGSSWIAYRSTRPAELRPLIRLDVDLGPDVTFGSTRGADVIISPDGTRLVYVSKGKLFTRRLDQPQATELAGTDGAFEPFFSPDGQWVAFFAGGKLKKLSVEGGGLITLCDAPRSTGGSWGDDGNIIAVLGSSARVLSRIPAAGGTAESLTKLDKGEDSHNWPQIIPGSDAVLFTAAPTNVAFEEASVQVFSSKNGSRKTLVRGGYFGRYVPATKTSGYLIYMHEGTLYEVAFDPARLELGGTPTPVLEDVAANPAVGAGNFDFSGTPSGTGILVYRNGTASRQGWPVAWLDSSGKTQTLLAKPGNYDAPRLSPEGHRLALEVIAGKSHDTYVYDFARDILSRVATNAGSPIWAPDGKHLAYSVGGVIGWLRADGAGEQQRLLEDKSQVSVVGYSFSPDGRRLAYMALNTQKNWDIWILPLDVSDPEHPKPGKPEPFLRTPASELEPVFSPDGRWIAYRSNESGTIELYVRSSESSPGGAGGKWQVSNGDVQHPRWLREGRQLFWETLDNHIMVADYTLEGDSFIPGNPRLWSPVQTLAPSGVYNMDVSADGKRLVVFPRPGVKEETGSARVTFLLNFFDELRRKVPLPK